MQRDRHSVPNNLTERQVCRWRQGRETGQTKKMMGQRDRQGDGDKLERQKGSKGETDGCSKTAAGHFISRL